MTLILIDARLGWGSGIGRYVVNTIPLVARLLPHVKFDLLVGADDLASANAVAARAPNVHPIVSPLRAFSLGEQLRFPKVARGYDLVWFTNYWVPLAFRGRYYAMVHDMLHLERDLFPASLPKRLLSYLTFRHVAKSAAAISFLSRFSQREFERRFESKAQMVVASCGMDHADWQMFDPEQPPKKERRLLVVAAAKKHKNFRIAVDAFLRAKIGPEWRLTIVTPNDKLRSSINLHEFVESGSRVDFRQGLTNAELRDLYGSTAILLMPSLYEGFGLPLAEGLQAGAICISSTAASLVEVGQGADISFCNADDLDGWVAAIEAECSRFDKGEIDHVITSRNMRHAAEFTWAEVAQKISKLITGVLDERNSDPIKIASLRSNKEKV
jgi:glycosyltransferase involved in cell wall biosynthesis